MSFQDEIEKWAKSSAGKKMIETERKRAMAEGREFGQVAGRSSKLPNYYADRLIVLLKEEIRAAGFEFGDYLYRVDVGYNEAEQRYEMHVNFKPKEIGRPSLYPEKYKNGAYDIVALMNHGYHARDHVYGMWHDQRIRSLRDREGAHFIQKAVDRFNGEHGGSALAIYDERY